MLRVSILNNEPFHRRKAFQRREASRLYKSLFFQIQSNNLQLFRRYASRLYSQQRAISQTQGISKTRGIASLQILVFSNSV